MKKERLEELDKIDEESIIDDENIYSKKVREQLLENDELSPLEAGFMQGYDEAV